MKPWSNLGKREIGLELMMTMAPGALVLFGRRPVVNCAGKFEGYLFGYRGVKADPKLGNGEYTPFALLIGWRRYNS